MTDFAKPADEIPGDFAVHRRVRIQADPMSPDQNSALSAILATRDNFLAHAAAKGVERKLLGETFRYATRLDDSIAILFAVKDNIITIVDLMHVLNIDWTEWEKTPFP